MLFLTLSSELPLLLNFYQPAPFPLPHPWFSLTPSPYIHFSFHQPLSFTFSFTIPPHSPPYDITPLIYFLSHFFFHQHTIPHSLTIPFTFSCHRFHFFFHCFPPRISLLSPLSISLTLLHTHFSPSSTFVSRTKISLLWSSSSHYHLNYLPPLSTLPQSHKLWPADDSIPLLYRTSSHYYCYESTTPSSFTYNVFHILSHVLTLLP